MESINFIKGYGKVSNPSEFQQQPPSKRRRTIVAASILISLTFIIAALIGTLIHHSVTEEAAEEPEHRLQSDPTDSLKIVCAVTEHLDSCINSISSLNDPPKSDPVHFFNLSLQVTLRELTNLSSLPKTLISKSNDARGDGALKDCAALFDDALSQVTQSAELMKAGKRAGEEKLLTEMKISDMLTWISAAMTDQDTCLDGLDEMGSTAVVEVRARVQKSTEYMSNNLAILNNLGNLLGKFGLQMP
ncbi:OLC1v1012624C1 [Oldenlandia corymbosa var. corymbosa]|uniref:pectinesterase n=1 Tax=Oldenlandia corymbosa var. corymbosa TaxID=529605 RepID=A0AAV1DWC1_OLDCO|nr:OLC1v1012624C1 [Oldenlandia corymbosa var. corymbosa]